MKSSFIIISGTEYFRDLVQFAIQAQKLSVSPSACHYLSGLLTHYVDARNLYDPEFDECGNKNPQTLAELWLTAQNVQGSAQKDLLKKLGDKSLYISGLFSESLNRSLVDLDYYKNMGASAYRTLAATSQGESRSVFNEMALRFLDFVEILNVISHEAFTQTDQSILRLYESYLRTGSRLAQKKLEDLGVFTESSLNVKKVSGH